MSAAARATVAALTAAHALRARDITSAAVKLTRAVRIVAAWRTTLTVADASVATAYTVAERAADALAALRDAHAHTLTAGAWCATHPDRAAVAVTLADACVSAAVAALTPPHPRPLDLRRGGRLDSPHRGGHRRAYQEASS